MSDFVIWGLIVPPVVAVIVIAGAFWLERH